MKKIDSAELQNKLNEYVILDVRTPEEYTEAHLAGSVNIPVDDIIDGTYDLSQLPKDQEYLVYCRSGARSYGACEFLDKLGYHTTDLSGGLNDWQDANLPTE